MAGLALLAAGAAPLGAQTPPAPPDSSAGTTVETPPSRRDSVRAAREAEREAALGAASAGVDRRRVLSPAALLAGNVVAGAGLAVGRGAAEGVPAARWPGVAAGGAAAGAGFYAAKRFVGEGRTVAGFLLAYAAASLAENVAEGGHALGHVRLGLGPLDVRVATGLGARRPDAPGVAIEADPLSVGAALVLPLQGFRPRPCRAALCYEGAETVRFVRGGRRYRRAGRTVGRVVRTWPPFTRRTEAHEGIHVIQGLQLFAATPRGTLRALAGWSTDAAVAADVRVDWLAPVVGGLVFSLVPYERLWSEREAFTLADD